MTQGGSVDTGAAAVAPSVTSRAVIHTPDRRLRVFISSTLQELAEERAAVRDAVTRLGLAPIFFEAGARAHPPRELYRAYLDQSDVFLGIYWQSYGWVAPGESVSGLEDEYLLAGDKPKLLYVKGPAPDRQERLNDLLARIRDDDGASYQHFHTPQELADVVANDLAVLLTEVFEAAESPARGLTALPLPRTEDPTAAPARSARRQWSPPALPLPPTPLIGREREVSDVIALLRRDGVRLVTLSGPGGIGKSRLALEVANQLRDDRADGVWAVAMNTVRDPDLVPALIAQALDVDEHPDTATIDVLTEALRDAEMLLFVDGFEQVLDAAPLLSTLLLDCPGVTILVTSRAVLNLRAEHDYEVPPLELPAAGTDATAVGRSEAVELFVAAAEAASPGFALTDDNAADVAEICRQLDGLPLAIELAAARVRLLPPAALLARLSNRLSLLTGGPQDLPERQQTLRATLAWDYDLLDGEERAIFRRLSVCAGGFTLELAEVVTSAAGALGIDVVDGLDSLAGKSLLRRRADTVAAPRFRLLDTIREYAVERLDESGEAAVTRRAHAEYLATMVEQADFRGPDQLEWFDHVEVEHENLRAALRWAISSGDVELELRLCAAIGPFWRLHGHLMEGGRWMRGVLERSAHIENPARIKVLAGASQFPRARGDFEESERLLCQALDLADKLGDVRASAHTHRDLMAIFGERGDWALAQEHAQISLELFDRLGDEAGRAHALNALGVVADYAEDRDRALEWFAQSLEAMLRAGDRTGMAMVTMNIGYTLSRVGRLDEATTFLLRSLVQWRVLDNNWYAADCMEFLGYVLSATQRARTAAEALGCADAIRTAVGAVRAPSQQPEYDVELGRLRGQLAPQDLADSWATGARHALADEVTLLLTLVDDPRLAETADTTVELDLLHAAGLFVAAKS